MAMTGAPIGEPIPLGIIHPEDAEKLGIDIPEAEPAAKQLEAIRSQIADLRESVSRLARSAAQSVEQHPVTAVTFVSLGLLAVTMLTSPRRRRW
jgi:hypothetical protein